MALAFSGYVSSQDKDTKEARKIAENVKRKVEHTEKAEGSQDLVKDKVTVKKKDDGQPMVEQVGEASFYGPGFHGKKPRPEKDSIKTKKLQLIRRCRWERKLPLPISTTEPPSTSKSTIAAPMSKDAISTFQKAQLKNWA
jgi:hypothetical protein